MHDSTTRNRVSFDVKKQFSVSCCIMVDPHFGIFPSYAGSCKQIEEFRENRDHGMYKKERLSLAAWSIFEPKRGTLSPC